MHKKLNIVSLLIAIILVLLAFSQTPVQASEFEPFKVRITASTLRIRAEPTTQSAVKGWYSKNDIVEILGTAGTSGSWFKTSKGYISSEYTERCPETLTPNAQNSGFKNFKVTITATGLNVREGPTTATKIKGLYKKGDIVEIIGVAGTTGSWFRTNKGYIASNYTERYHEKEPSLKPENPNSNTNNKPTKPPLLTQKPFQTFKVVVNVGSLNIRLEPTTESAIKGRYSKGNVVEVIGTAGTSGSWYKTSKGYIASHLTKRYTGTTVKPEVPNPNETPFKAFKVIVTSATANVMAEPTIASAVKGQFVKGNIVEVIGTAGTSGSWFKTSKGYIGSHLTERYTGNKPAVQPGSPTTPNNPPFQTFKVIVTGTSVNIRTQPTTASAVKGRFLKGEIVEVIGTAGTTGSWYKTSKGYIASHLTERYVGFEKFKVKVTSSFLNIRAGATTSSAKLGRYLHGDIVEVIDTAGTWYKTSKGYIASQYTERVTGNPPVGGSSKRYISIKKNYAVLRTPGGQADERHVVAGDKFEAEEHGDYYKIKIGPIEGFIPKSICTVLPSAPKNDLTLAWQPVYSKYTNKSLYNSSDDYIMTSSAQLGLDAISPTWFDMTGTSTNPSSIKIIDKADREYVRIAHKNGYEVWPTFVEMNADRAYTMMTSASLRKATIDEITRLAVKYNCDGINVDFEGLGMKNKEPFVQFSKELYASLKARNICLSIDIIKPSSSETWSKWLDRKALSNYADYLMYMAYDQHTGASSNPGPNAGKPWVEDGIEAIINEGVPASKIVMCVPFYIRDFSYSDSTPHGQLPVPNTVLINKTTDIYSGNIKLGTAKANSTYKYKGASGSYYMIDFGGLTGYVKKNVSSMIMPSTKGMKRIGSKSYYMVASDNLDKRFGGTTYYDPYNDQNVMTYIQDGLKHIHWVEDEHSMAWRMDLVNKHNIAGIAAWQLGQEPRSIWSLIKSKLK